MRLGWVVKKQNKKASAYIGFVPLPMEFQRRRSANHFLLLQLLPAKDAKFSLLNHFEGEKAQNNKGRRNIYTTGAAYIAVRVRHKIYDIFFWVVLFLRQVWIESSSPMEEEQMYFYILSHVFLYSNSYTKRKFQLLPNLFLILYFFKKAAENVEEKKGEREPVPRFLFYPWKREKKDKK